MSDRARERHIKEAAQALSDLNIFHGIIALLEGGTIHAPSQRAASYIIRHCKKASADCLSRYDLALINLDIEP